MGNCSPGWCCGQQHLLLLSALLLLLTPKPCSSQTGSQPSDEEQLLAFKAAFSNGATVLGDWNGSDTSPCGWSGLQCNIGGRVSHMFLGNRGLQGSMPPAGLPLPATLLEVYLFNNKLTGSIPGDWVLPGTLRTIQLSNVGLSGTLSPDWRLPSPIISVDLTLNALHGSIPQAWEGTLPLGFEKLDLAKNNLSGTLPSWKNHTTLRVYLFPGNTGLCGTVPAAPVYATWNMSSNQGSTLVKTLPPCPGPGSSGVLAPADSPPGQATDPGGASSSSSSSSSGGSSGNTAVIAGVVAGTVGALVVVAIPGFLYWQRRRRRRYLVALGAGPPAGMEQGLGGGKAGIGCDPPKQGSPPPSPEDSSQPSPPPSSPGRQSITRAETLVTNSSWGETGDLQRNQPPDSASVQWAEGMPRPPVEDDPNLLASDPFLASAVSKLHPALPPSSSPQQSEPPTPTSPLLPPALSAAGLQPPAGSSGDASLSRDSSFGLQPWVVPFDSIKFHRVIGSGSFGRVYLATWNQTQVAVKLLLGEGATTQNSAEAAERALSPDNPLLASLQQESSILIQLRHPNVLMIMGLCTMPPCLVCEYCPRGSLRACLNEARDFPSAEARLDWAKRLRMALGAAKGMAYLHSKAIIHRDLRSPNLLVAGWNVKVADFNLSKLMEEGSGGSSLSATNPRWLAPEVLQGERHTFASDVFSFGVILWELLTLQLPWTGVPNVWQVAKLLIDGQRLAVPDAAQLPAHIAAFEGLGGYVGLMQRCWVQEPSQRPSFADICVDLRQLLLLTPRDGSSSVSAGSMPPLLTEPSLDLGLRPSLSLKRLD